MNGTPVNLLEARWLRIRRSTLLVLVLLVVSQRLGLNVGGVTISASFGVVIILALHALRWRYAYVGPGSLIVWGCLAILAGASTAGALLAGEEYSAASAAAFLAATLVLVLRPAAGADARRASREGLDSGFRWLGVLVAGLVGLQWAYQLVSSGYLDPLAMLPEELLVGGYNTRASVHYDLALARPNGMFFLEPSLASQFLGLAAAVTYMNARLAQRTRRWTLAAILGGLLLTASGTGVVVFAIAWLIAARPVRVLKTSAVAGACAVLFFSLVDYRSLAGGVVAARFEEASSSRGSGQSRFVAPYRLVWSEGFGAPDQIAFGRGPGDADDTREKLLVAGRGHHFFSTQLKLYWEYGVFACGLLLGWLAWIVRGVANRERALVWALFAQYVLLTGSLVFPFQPALLVLVVLATEPTGRTGWLSTAAPGMRSYTPVRWQPRQAQG